MVVVSCSDCMSIYDDMIGKLRAMPIEARRDMLVDVIETMNERDDAEEIARFLAIELGGDAPGVVASYAYHDDAGSRIEVTDGLLKLLRLIREVDALRQKLPGAESIDEPSQLPEIRQLKNR
jgi:hypothetical protein